LIHGETSSAPGVAPKLPGNGGTKTQTKAKDLKPKRESHQAPTPHDKKSQTAAAEALALGRGDALDSGDVLHLQKAAGNAAVSAAIEKSAPHGAAPHLVKGAVNVSSLFASEAPALVPLISAEQLKALQDPYNVRASNADVKRRYNDLKKRRERDEYPADQAWDRRLDQVWSQLQPEPTGPDQVTVPTVSLLDPAILEVPLGDEEAEGTFRKAVFAELSKTPVVNVRIGDRMLSALERGDEGGYNKPEVLLECGGVKLPHTKGRVTFADLTSRGGSPYARRYREQVTNRAEVAFYKAPMETVTKRIISGGKMSKSTKEWADMIAKETLTDAAAGASGKDLAQAMTKFVIKMTGSEPEHGKAEH
jgi:hypothetical protein